MASAGIPSAATTANVQLARSWRKMENRVEVMFCTVSHCYEEIKDDIRKEKEMLAFIWRQLKNTYSELSRVQIFSCLDYEGVTIRTLQRVGFLFSFFFFLKKCYRLTWIDCAMF